MGARFRPIYKPINLENIKDKLLGTMFETYYGEIENEKFSNKIFNSNIHIPLTSKLSAFSQFFKGFNEVCNVTNNKENYTCNMKEELNIIYKIVSF